MKALVNRKITSEVNTRGDTVDTFSSFEKDEYSWLHEFLKSILSCFKYLKSRFLTRQMTAADECLQLQGIVTVAVYSEVSHLW